MAKLLAKKGSAIMKKCAFCTNWYDPSNSAIQPKQGQKDVWEYTTGIKKQCTQRNNMQVLSQNCCPKFQCKIL